MTCPQCKRRSNTGGLCTICIITNGESELNRVLFSIATPLDMNDLPNPFEIEFSDEEKMPWQ